MAFTSSSYWIDARSSSLRVLVVVGGTVVVVVGGTVAVGVGSSTVDAADVVSTASEPAQAAKSRAMAVTVALAFMLSPD